MKIKERRVFRQTIAMVMLIGGLVANTNAQVVANGDFSLETLGTVKTVSGPGAVSAAFNNWRIFANNATNGTTFRGTVVSNPSSAGNLAMKLDYNQPTGGSKPSNYTFYQDSSSRLSATYGKVYEISFDAAFVGGSSNLLVYLPEYTNSAFTGSQVMKTITITNTALQTFSFHWSPASASNGFSLAVSLNFKPLLVGSATNASFILDNVQFTEFEVPGWLDPIFSSDMVLQRNEPVHIYGAGPGIEGDTMVVAFGGQTKTTTVANGAWEVWLDPMDANTQGQTLSVSRNGNVVASCTNILVGDVWVLGGQSNMANPIKNYSTLIPMIHAANQPLIRLSYVDYPAQSPQQTKVPQPFREVPVMRHWKWYPCVYPGADIEAKALMEDFSPAGYFFGTNLVAHTQVPVGLVMACRGATKAQWWTPMDTLTQYPELDVYVKQNDKNSSYLYNSVIYPIRKFTIRGVLWYQGEGDNPLPKEYGLLFPRMIQSWREAWGKNMPFIFASLSSYKWPTDSWAYLRESQAKGLSQPDTGMIMTYDVGDYPNIHPEDKITVGYRFYMKAREVAYGESLVSSGPVLDHLTVDGNLATVHFTNMGSGLETRTVSMPKNAARTEFYTAGSNTLAGFTLCGPDWIFHPAQAVISGTDSVVLQSAAVDEPIAVRYAWATFALANLFNREGFPAEPFRTDTFPVPRFTLAAPTSLLTNGSFESQPLGTTKSIGSSAVVDTTTFTAWRVFSVGSPAVSNFTATIIDNATDGNLAMRLDLINTGGGTGLDHGLDNANARIPVTVGAYYNISFDAAWISGATNLVFGMAEFDAAGVFTGKSTSTNLVVSDTNYQNFSFMHWTPISPATAKVSLAFRQRNSGTLTSSSMSFDNVRVTSAGTSQSTDVSISNSTATISFEGNPGYVYVTQRSTNLLDWVNIATNQAPDIRSFSITDEIDSQTAAFYRLWQPW